MKAKVMATVYSMMFLAALFLSGCGSALRYDNAAKAYEKGQYDQALKLYQQIVKESPKGKYFSQANFMVGEIYRRQFRWDNALKYYQVTADSEGASYLGTQARNRMAQIRDGVKVIKEAKAIYDNNPKTPEGNNAAAEALFKLGETYAGPLENYTEAIKWYRKLVEEFPKHSRTSQAQFNIGNIYFYKLYNYKGGWPEYSKVIEKWPSSFEANAAKEALINTKKWLNAILEEQMFIKGKQRISDEAIESGALIGVGQNRYKQNAEEVAKAYLRIGDHWRLNLKNYPAAIETYHTLIEELPFELFVVGDAQFRIGQLYQELGEFDKAVEAYQTLMKRWPQSFRRDEAVYNMAICYETMQDYKNAYEYYKIYVSFGDKTEFFRAAEQKMRQYEYDEDGDGFSFWREQQADTSDQDKNSYPGAKVLKPKR